MRRLRYLWRRHRVATVLFALVLAVTVAMGTRSVMFAIWWADPAHRFQEIESWMTPRYIAHSWKVPPHVVQDALTLDRLPGRRLTLEDLAEARGLPVAILIDQVEAAIAQHRPERPARRP
ncbi:hypothetical protein [Oceaniglobus trochenteri]|uniref:hypothetical protein n=1 Tax=Oceaniglobus trochenteri TaxID=2763260 RepID=UPI001D000816|nr:hypothetical protein [Oceaniglobus trochenteri]